MSDWKQFRKIVDDIDAAMKEIENAAYLPRKREAEMQGVRLTGDGYRGFDALSPEAQARSKAVLREAIVAARAGGERERDAVIGAQAAKLHSLRSALNVAKGAALIDVGCIARNAISKASAAP